MPLAQIIPRKLPELMKGSPTERSERVMQAAMGMKTINIAALERPVRGEPARR